MVRVKGMSKTEGGAGRLGTTTATGEVGEKVGNEPQGKREQAQVKPQRARKPCQDPEGYRGPSTPTCLGAWCPQP